jgi:hypothetical protein
LAELRVVLSEDGVDDVKGHRATADVRADGDLRDREAQEDTRGDESDPRRPRPSRRSRHQLR